MLQRWVCALGITITFAKGSFGLCLWPAPPPMGAPSQADPRYSAEVRAHETSRVGALDYAWIAYETTPLLSGLILAPESWPKIMNPARPIPAGAVVLVGECELDLGDWRAELSDVAFVGLGPERSRIRIRLGGAACLSFENLTIDCDNNDFADLRHRDSIRL